MSMIFFFFDGTKLHKLHEYGIKCGVNFFLALQTGHNFLYNGPLTCLILQRNLFFEWKKVKGKCTFCIQHLDFQI